MRRFVPTASAILAVLALLGASSNARATIDDGTADTVFGQPSMDVGAPPIAISSSVVSKPMGIAADPQGFEPWWLVIADRDDNRAFAPSLPTFSPNTFLLGQPTFDVGLPNQGGTISEVTMNGPTAVALTGNVYLVADTGNHRVFAGFIPGFPAVVLGQNGRRDTGEPNLGGISASSMSSPRGVAALSDGSTYVFVADSGNHRLLEFQYSRLDTAATVVVGQDTMNAGDPNHGSVTPLAEGLSSPQGLVAHMFVESGVVQRGLYVADTGNNRVLHFVWEPALDGPPRLNRAADVVYGQPSFTTGEPNHGGLSARSMNGPTAVAVDPLFGLWVADTGNHRVLHFKRGSTTADRVLGQPDFTHGTPPTTTSATTLNAPSGVAVSRTGDLYVADTGASRILRFKFVGSAAACDDGNACTEDSWSPTSGCVHTAPRTDEKACAPFFCNTVTRTCEVTCLSSGCQFPYQCTGAGTCAQRCFAGGSPCKSGVCRDGWCCDGACGGQCEACDNPGQEGRCTPIHGRPQDHGVLSAERRSPCAASAVGDDRECTGTCAGNRNACVPAAVDAACGVESCDDGIAHVRGGCDGRGRCIATTIACAPYACAVNGCRTACDGDFDCVTDARCVEGVCVTPSNGALAGGTGCNVEGDRTDVDLAPVLIGLGALALSIASRRRSRRSR